VLQLYEQTDLQEEKDRILRAFSTAVDPDLVDEILLFTQSVSIIILFVSVIITRPKQNRWVSKFQLREKSFLHDDTKSEIFLHAVIFI
jgi:hypothetical protein